MRIILPRLKHILKTQSALVKLTGFKHSIILAVYLAFFVLFWLSILLFCPCIREDKTGYIENRKFPILTRLGLEPEQWLSLTTEFEKHFCYAAGAEQMMEKFKAHTHHKRLRGMGKARELLKQA